MTARKDGHFDPWCNGSTADFGSAGPGSNPGGSTLKTNRHERIQEQARRAVEAAECGAADVAPGITRQGDEGTRREVQARLRAVAADGEKYTVDGISADLIRY